MPQSVGSVARSRMISGLSPSGSVRRECQSRAQKYGEPPSGQRTAREKSLRRSDSVQATEARRHHRRFGGGYLRPGLQSDAIRRRWIGMAGVRAAGGARRRSRRVRSWPGGGCRAGSVARRSRLPAYRGQSTCVTGSSRGGSSARPPNPREFSSPRSSTAGAGAGGAWAWWVPATALLQPIDRQGFARWTGRQFRTRGTRAASLRGCGVSDFLTAPVPRVAVTREQAADSLGMSLDSFERHVQPEVRIIRRGRMRLVAIAELERWADEAGERTIP